MILAALVMVAPFLLSMVSSAPRPQSSVHVKFVSPTQHYAHGVEIASPDSTYGHFSDVRPVSYHPRASQSYDYLHQPSLIRGARKFVYPSERRLISNHQEVSFLPSNDISTQIAYDSIQQPQYYTDAQQLDNEIEDPLLLTGDDAVAAVKYLFGRGELYWSDIPHSRALERHQEERRINGLELNRLSSNRPESPYFRGGLPYGAIKNRRRAYYAFQ